jgi:acyl carrier protein
MTSTISSRTPEGDPNHCPVCDKSICIEASRPPGDAPCPNCGTLLWFFETSAGMRFHELKAVAPLRDRILKIIGERLGLSKDQVAKSFVDDLDVTSLDVVELIMELEEAFDLNIPDDEAEKIHTVGDAIDYLAKRKL